MHYLNYAKLYFKDSVATVDAEPIDLRSCAIVEVPGLSEEDVSFILSSIDDPKMPVNEEMWLEIVRRCVRYAFLAKGPGAPITFPKFREPQKRFINRNEDIAIPILQKYLAAGHLLRLSQTQQVKLSATHAY